MTRTTTMTPSTTKRQDHGGPGPKALIAAASVAATLSGWAMLTLHDDTQASATEPSQAQAQDAVAAPAQQAQQGYTLDPSTLPAIEPLPTLLPAQDLSGLAGGQQNAQAQVAQHAATVTPQPVQPTPTAQPRLRVVTPPNMSAQQPAPVTRSRSSR